MIRVSVHYPVSDDATFDHDYYRDSHVPLVVRSWNPVRAEIDRGLNGPYVAAAHFFFDTLESFQAAMGSPGTGEVMADLGNYTNITPLLQVSELVEEPAA